MTTGRRQALWLLWGGALVAGAAAGPGGARGAPIPPGITQTTFRNPQNGTVRKFVNIDRSPLPGTPEEVATTFLDRHADQLFGTPAVARDAGLTLGDVTLRDERTVSSVSGYHVWKKAWLAGIPIHNGWVVTHLTHDGRVLFVTNDMGRPASGLTATRASLTATDALRAAGTLIGGDGATRATPRAELVVLRQTGSDRLAWRTETATWNPYGDWEIFVDAVTGTEIVRNDRLIVDGPDPQPARLTPPAADQAKALPPYDPATALRVDGTGYVFSANPLNNHPERYSWRDQEPLVDSVRNAIVLTDLDGTGYLRGPWVEVFNTDATRALEPTLVFQYSALPVNGHFQEVNVYYHINGMQAYIQNTLGIPNARNRLTNCCAHQGEDDNSDYSPSEDRIRYGDGGVDDSDDGEIVVHEYGHALHEDIVPGFVYAGESGAISEGFGDYLSVIQGNNALCGEWDATAYNPGPPPFLRRADNTRHYPEDFVGEVHDDGEIINGAWWDLRQLVGATVSDRLVVAGMFYTGTTATFQDYADGVVAADQALYGGAHLGYIYQAFGNRGIGATYLLNVAHTPLGDTEHAAGPYPVVCTIGHTSPITSAGAVQLHYALPGDPGFTDVVMNQTGGFDEWAAPIPGPGVNGEIRYYLSVTDDLAVAARLPSVADIWFTFTIGPDTQPPVITHTPVPGTCPRLRWPPVVSAVVTDNLGVASISFAYTLNGLPQPMVTMASAGGDTWSAPFPEAVASVHIGDEFTYTITAIDASSQALVTTSGPHTFTVIEARGVVLILDDDLLPTSQDVKWTSDKQPLPLPPRDPATLGVSASTMATILTAAGYVVVEESVSASNPATWSSYSFLISSSGNNTTPVTDAAYRAALEAYVAAGGKLISEGGEVAFKAISNPGYPSFATGIVHGYDWDCDSCGNGLTVNTGQATHPLMTTPWAIPSNLAITYTDYGDLDGFKANADATVVMSVNQYPGEAGVLVHDNNGNPGSAQIVGFSFNFAALTNQAAAAHLLDNAARFLTTVEQPGTSGLGGTCHVFGASDNSGVTVTCNPGSLTWVTGPTGHYEFTSLFAGTCTVTANKTGYGSAPLTVTLGPGQVLTHVDFGLAPVREFTCCDSPPTPVSIPDNNQVGLTRTLLVTASGPLSNIYCAVDITHTWKGDLIVELISPTGTTVRLHNRTGSSTDNIITTYDSLTAPDGPGVMNNFDGRNPLGEWRLFVSDTAGGDTGRLNSWGLNLFVAEDVVGTIGTPLTAATTMGGVSLSWTYDPAAVDGCHVYRRLGSGPETRLTDSLLTARDGRISFVDPAAGLPAGVSASYRYALLVNGREIGRSDAVTVTPGGATPPAFRLAPIFPNPFNPSTNVKFAVPRAAHVAVKVYDLAGRLVRTLVAADLPAAEHVVVWDGRDSGGQTAASGTYYCRMKSEGFSAVRKMTLVK
jgi:subtilisin-like proprotein convertase family protein/Zn-dependent metalloprotease